MDEEFNPVSKLMSWLAWVLCVIAILGACFSLALTLNQPNVRDDSFAIANALLNALYTAAFGIVGALILSHQARNRIGWLMMTIGVSLATAGAVLNYLPQIASASSKVSFATYLSIWLNGWAWWLLVGPLLLILLLFPTGRLLSPRWRWVVALLAALFAVFTLLLLLAAEWQDASTGQKVPNPLGIRIVTFSFDTIAIPYVATLVTTVALCVLAVAVRFRRAGGVEREQLKWILTACALLLLSYVVGTFQGPSSASGTNGFSLLLDIAFLSVPVSIGVAILRYRLWDIDIIIRRTVTYAIVVALLAIVYFGSVILLQQIFANLTGLKGNEIITVLSTLAIAALFVPLRNRIQNAIDKRFNRRKYNAQQVLTKFAETARDETDLDKLTAELINVVQETMQPKSVSVWLKTTNDGDASSRTPRVSGIMRDDASGRRMTK